MVVHGQDIRRAAMGKHALAVERGSGPAQALPHPRSPRMERPGRGCDEVRPSVFREVDCERTEVQEAVCAPCGLADGFEHTRAGRTQVRLAEPVLDAAVQPGRRPAPR